MDELAVIAGYDALLSSVGERAGDIGTRPVVTHWPHIGSAYRGLVIVGQAVYGWGDDYTAAHFQTEAGRRAGIAAFRARVDKPDPLHWIETHPVRTSPFWRAVRRLAEALEPDLDAPWYARFAVGEPIPGSPRESAGKSGWRPEGSTGSPRWPATARRHRLARRQTCDRGRWAVLVVGRRSNRLGGVAGAA